MSGYLDDYQGRQGGSSSNSGSGSGATSSALLAHLQQQSYSRRIPPSGRSRFAQDDDDVDDVDDDGLSITTWDSEEEAKRAQEEWEESLKQLNLAVQVMILPFFGKWLGRKWSYWGG